MNERIKAIAKQATTSYSGLGEIDTYLDPEKFAELIVKECAKIAMDSSVSDQASEDEWHADRIILTVSDNILEHFGIEE